MNHLKNILCLFLLCYSNFSTVAQVLIEPPCDYSSSDNITLVSTPSGQEGDTLAYYLTDDNGLILQGPLLTPTFGTLAAGGYLAFAVTADSTLGAESNIYNLTTLGTCIDISTPFELLVCHSDTLSTADSISVVGNGGSGTGNTWTLLVDSAGVILDIQNGDSATFAPRPLGEYFAYIYASDNPSDAPTIGENIDTISCSGCCDWSTPYSVNVAPVLLLPQVFLSGNYDVNTSMMYDSLRSHGIIPLAEPYTNLHFFAPGVIAGGETITDSATVFGVTGSDAIVDWVVVELRDKTDSTQILETKVGLLQRDGDVADVDGISPLSFTLSADDYYIAIRHRNHFGAMTDTPITLSSTVTTVDFRDPTAINGVNTWTNTMNAQRDLTDGNFGLWTGNAEIDNVIKFEGGTNDKDKIGATVINAPGNTTFAANYVHPGYSSSDLNLDGIVKFEGGSNDKDLLSVIVITHVLNETFAANFILREQLPE